MELLAKSLLALSDPFVSTVAWVIGTKLEMVRKILVLRNISFVECIGLVDLKAMQFQFRMHCLQAVSHDLRTVFLYCL